MFLLKRWHFAERVQNLRNLTAASLFRRGHRLLDRDVLFDVEFLTILQFNLRDLANEFFVVSSRPISTIAP